MRMLLRVQMDAEAGHRAISDGSWDVAMQRLIATAKPEAAYFAALDGRFTALIVFDLEDSSQIPSVAEPLLMAVNTSMDFTPAMTVEDLRGEMQ
jgi:hypothetical protein